MKAKLVVEGKEFPVEILDPELQKLIAPHKRTGYDKKKDEVVKSHYYYIDDVEKVNYREDNSDVVSQMHYDNVNYYNDIDVAKNNARADKLMRKLRRYAVEHRKGDVNWEMCRYKYRILYNHRTKLLNVIPDTDIQTYGAIYFDNEVVAHNAIDTFRDELTWYFTEYKDSL